MQWTELSLSSFLVGALEHLIWILASSKGLCGSVSVQAPWVPRGRGNTVTWAGGGGEAALGKGPEEFCYCEKKRLVARLFSGDRRSHLRIVLLHSGSTLLSTTPALPLTVWTPTSLPVVASVVGRQGCEKTFSSLQYSDSVIAFPWIPSHFTFLWLSLRK